MFLLPMSYDAWCKCSVPAWSYPFLFSSLISPSAWLNPIFPFYLLWSVNVPAHITTIIVRCRAPPTLLCYMTLRALDDGTSHSHSVGFAGSWFWLISAKPNSVWINKYRMLYLSRLVNNSQISEHQKKWHCSPLPVSWFRKTKSHQWGPLVPQ